MRKIRGLNLSRLTIPYFSAICNRKVKKKKGLGRYQNCQPLAFLVPGTRLELVQPLRAEGF
jgi:hypothetical protein